METEKVEGADNSATETTAAAETQDTGMDLAAYAKQAAEAKEAPAAEAAPAPAEEKDEWLQPPSALKPEFKAEWAKLPKPIRGEFYRRESDFHKGIEPYKGSHTQWEKLNKELAPYQARLNAVGGVEGFAREYAQLDHILTTGTPQQKAQAFAAFQKYYGFEAPQPGQQATQQQVDPTIRQMQEELAQLRGTLTQSQTAVQQREQQEALSKIDAFKADPKNIYFEDVKDDMAAILGAGRAQDLADAYDKACRMNPAVYAAVAKQQRETEEKNRIEEAKRKTADAKRAGFEVQAQGAAQSGSKTLSLREELAQRAGVQLNQ